MLHEIGKVVTIVSEDMVLIRSSEPIEVDTLVVAFIRHSVDIPDCLPSQREIVIPKGTLDVIMDEGDGLYLAERYRERRQQIMNPATFLGLGVETVKGDWSATINPARVRGAVSRLISVGDLIGVEK